VFCANCGAGAAVEAADTGELREEPAGDSAA
jgi:hypothetical protein